MLDEVTRLKERYQHQIEDGRKIESFTSTDEWHWYVDNVIMPTVTEYTDRIMTGKIESAKADWILRGMVMGMKMIVDTTEGFKAGADEARKKAKLLQEELEDA